MLDHDDDDLDARPAVPWRFRDPRQQVIHGHRASPWHPLQPEEAPEVSLTPAERRRQAWHAHPIYRAIQGLADRGMGWREAWHQRGNRRPSWAAQEEWWAYYQGLYQGKDPDVAQYARLLRRRGVPDWINPYPPGEPGHYDFHADGLLAADLEAILRGIRLTLMTPAPLPAPSTVNAMPTAAVPTPQEWRAAHILHQYEAARLCWALVVARGQPLPVLTQQIHASNLAMALTDVAAAPLTQVGLTPAKLFAGAVRARLLPADEARKILDLVTAIGPADKATPVPRAGAGPA